MAKATGGQNTSGGVAIDSAFVDSIRQRLPVTTRPPPSNEQPTIYRVPERIRQHKIEAYEPRSVSIGPYHHNKQSLQPMEEHKWRYLQAILSRNPAVSLEDYLAKIKALETQARRSYSERIELDSNEFLKMMLLDGCFIVELFAKRWKEDGNDDPIYRNKGLLKDLYRDMLLFENQLPYCILQCIFGCVFPGELADVQLVKAATEFYDIISWLPCRLDPYKVNSYHHLLHLIHCRLLPNDRNPKIPLRYPTIPSAEKLKESGIEFKKKVNEQCVLDVEFKNGVIEIPNLLIDATTICLFRNFVAFEQCYRSAGSYFTVYTDFMGNIINTKADVEILRDKRILVHACGSNKELALVFNGLNKGNAVGTSDYYLSSLFNDVNEYCSTKWHRWRASLMRYYFRDLPAILALIGAVVVVILAVLQSFLSVYARVRPPHQS